jgi:pimeloyl-ACP methyl ester carboxylesterase
MFSIRKVCSSSRAVFIGLSLILLVRITAAQSQPQLVDLGGYKLDVQLSGKGDPTIVLVAGLGDALDDWSKIFPSISALSRAVSYSRSGLGRSDLGPSDHSARSNVAELHTLLAKLKLKPPYVLVGRSYGSILVRLYTSLYPSEVGGLVIVDGTHEQQVRRWGKLDETYPDAFRKFFEDKLKTMKPGAEMDETRETVRIQAAGTVEGLTPLPDIPIAVLTSMKVAQVAQYVNQTVKGHEEWRAMHDEWFRRSTNGLHIVTDRSGHSIQDDEPELVMMAIRFVLDRIRPK